MGKTSAASINKYMNKVYDRINLTVPKGRQADIKAFAESRGESVNGLINRLIQAEMGLSDDDWKATDKAE